MLKFFLYWLVGHAHSSLKRLEKMSAYIKED